jgi:hypothetical protein
MSLMLTSVSEENELFNWTLLNFINSKAGNNGTSERSSNRIRPHELIGSLKNVSNIGSLRKVLSKTHKRTKVLETPLPKHVSDKVHNNQFKFIHFITFNN